MTTSRLICEAIRNRRLISFRYDGYLRTVEPQTIGLDAKGHDALRPFQIAGGRQSGAVTEWKLFHVRKMLNFGTSWSRADLLRADSSWPKFAHEVPLR